MFNIILRIEPEFTYLSYMYYLVNQNLWEFELVKNCQQDSMLGSFIYFANSAAELTTVLDLATFGNETSRLEKKLNNADIGIVVGSDVSSIATYTSFADKVFRGRRQLIVFDDAADYSSAVEFSELPE